MSVVEMLPSSQLLLMSSLGILDRQGQKVRRDYLEVQNVRVTPGELCFLGAYDGKQFDEKFSIVNHGKKPAFVRIFPTTSKAFQMKSLQKGVMLSPGMSLVRHVKYTCNTAVAIPQAFLYIYINEVPLLYSLDVQVASSLVRVSPRMLHFGEIDVGTSSKQLSLFLTNQGQRNAHFIIDLGPNDLELLVDPMRGKIQPKQTEEVKVEILGSREGYFLKEFWIKTEPLQRIWITGTFIRPKLKIEHPDTCDFDLVVIDFPKTYYKAENSRTIIIKNSSSTDSMFCAVAEYKRDENIKLEEARKLNQNLMFFNIDPKEGRLLNNHKAAITITFAPRKTKTFLQKYCIIFVRIMKINYRDGWVKDKELNVKTFSSSSESYDTYQISSFKSTESIYAVTWDFETSYLRLCLYGEIEEPNVKLTPSAFDRNDMHLGEYSRLTTNIKNCSLHLPIIFKYEKIASIEMDPIEATLKPNSSLDVLLILTPHSLGQFHKTINLGLFYKNRDGNVFRVGTAYLRVDYTAHPNIEKLSPLLKPKFVMGITSPFESGVGQRVDNVRFNNADIKEVPVSAFTNKTNMKKCLNKDNSNLIAFPNDRPTWFYPWQNDIPCTTIFTQFPRYNTPFDCTYTYSPSKRMEKRENEQKYIDFIRKRSEKIMRTKKPKIEQVCYPTSQSKVLLTNEKLGGCMLPFSKVENKPKFIPLTPEELMDIEIMPRYVILGKIAPHIVCSDFFEIKNNNSFSVIINIYALSNCVIVKGKKRQHIEGHKSAKVYFDCYSYGLGKYYVPVHILINDFHIFDATVFAEVVPTTVQCKSPEVMISAKDNVGFLELYNPVNCAIDFEWEVQEKNYEIVPEKGQIESRKTLYCKVSFTPRRDSVFRTEMFLLSQSGAKQVVKILNEQAKVSVRFSNTSIEMKSTPLNIKISKELVVRNESDQAIVLFVKDPNPIEQITVIPSEGVIEGKGDMFFQINAHFKTIKTFSCNLEFVMLDGREHIVRVSGNVAIPNVLIEPDLMHIPKIVTMAYQRRVFRLNNNCNAITKIRFLLNHYPDLIITDMNRNKITGEIILPPKDFMELYLEFQPKEPTSYTLYLPYIINDLIGPPLLNNPNSFKIGTYLEPPNPYLSRSMSTLRITCAAGAPWFKLSPCTLKLTEEKREKAFKITNISSVSHKITFMLNEIIDTSFRIKVSGCNGKFKILENNIKAYLDPGKSIELGFRFISKDYGSCRAVVPIFVREYFENCAFNYIKLYGVINKASIEAKYRIVCMPAIPLKKIYTKEVKLYLHHHKLDCVVTIDQNHEYLKVETKIESDTIEMMISFIPKTECTVESEIIVSCTCGASCILLVAAECDKCTLLTYRHKIKVWSEKFDTIDHQDSNFDQQTASSLKKIDRMNDIVQKYVFSQGFFANNYYTIPETITRYPFGIYWIVKTKGPRRPKVEKNLHLPIVYLFKNLTFPNVVRNLTDGVNFASLDDREGTAYDYSVYKNVLKYLEDYGVFVKNLIPEFLLSYKRYVVFKTQLIDEESLCGDEILPENVFMLKSKQCWLDLIIKIYKLLHYDRLLKNIPPDTGPLEVSNIYKEELMEYYESQIDLFPPHMNECERKLLLWVEFHFKKEKDKLWPNQHLPDRPIRDLITDFRDSLPFATLMVAYCPYLANSFKEMYLDDSETSAIHHNACLISEAWNVLKLSYKIKTRCIYRPINTEMLFLLSYLYVVLPSFYPSETITITSQLGQTSSAKVMLKNTLFEPIGYDSVLVLNDNESFQIDSTHTDINPKAEKSVLVSYTAKQIVQEKAVLVLSGESSGTKYSKSLAINLIGVPDILFFNQEVKIRVDMYKTVQKTIDVVSPYAQEYVANTYFYLYQEGKPPLTMEDFVSISSLPGLPRQLELENVCHFDEQGTHKLKISLCFITMGDWTYFIYFTNKDVGLFSIKLKIRSIPADDTFEEIDVRIPLNFDPEAPCKCKRKVRNLLCPRIMYADIPFQNKDLLEGVRNMIKIYANQEELKFWDSYLVFPKGFHIFRAYLENTYRLDFIPFKEVLHPMVTYITEPAGRHFSVEPEINIDDSTLDGCYKLMIHWNLSEYPDREVLYLQSDNGLESRSYMLKFWSRDPDKYKNSKPTKIVRSKAAELLRGEW